MNISDNERFHELAHKALAKQATPAEQQELRALIAENPKLKEEMEQLGGEAAVIRELLPLLEELDQPPRGISHVLMDRLKTEVGEVLFEKKKLWRDLEGLNKLVAERRRRLEGWDLRGAQTEGLRGIAQLTDEFLSELFVSENDPWESFRTQVEELMRAAGEFQAVTTLAIQSKPETEDKPGGLSAEDVLDLYPEMDAGIEKFKGSEGSSQRPDLIFPLPGDRRVIINSTASLEAYEHCCKTTDPTDRSTAAREHIKALRSHIELLNLKRTGYAWHCAPDFVFLFIAAEPALRLALAHDLDLFADAFKKRVLLVTPLTLRATLRLVARFSMRRLGQSSQSVELEAGKRSQSEQEKQFLEAIRKAFSSLPE